MTSEHPRSLWAATATPAAAHAPLRGEERADVCVIGGGFTGLSAALHPAAGGAAGGLLVGARGGSGGGGRGEGPAGGAARPAGGRTGGAI